MRRDRWIAAMIGFAGVLVVVLPKMSGTGGWYNLVMLASAPVFAASFLITKALTRYEKPGVIVLWQAITVTVLSLPMALPNWQNPTLVQNWRGTRVGGGRVKAGEGARLHIIGQCQGQRRCTLPVAASCRAQSTA
jgi:hypothetical protein